MPPKKKSKPVEIKPPDHPWDKLENETDNAWDAFVIYRDIQVPGHDRSQREVCEILSKNRATITDWAVKYDWVKRCHEYDQHLDREARKVMMAERAKMIKQKLRLTQVRLQTALREAHKQEKASEAAGDCLLSPEQIERIATEVIKEVAVECEMPSEIIEQRQTVTIEDKRAVLHELLSRHKNYIPDPSSRDDDDVLTD
jgi:hypothetical protein